MSGYPFDLFLIFVVVLGRFLQECYVRMRVAMKYPEIHTCADLTAFIDEIGFLPLLSMGLAGWSAEEVADEDCQYTQLPDGGWEWPLWEWKGTVIQESGCAYGKFLMGKAAFVSKEWWPDFCNWRRHRNPYPAPESIEEAILLTLKENGSMITRDLRASCGFTGAKMRGKFDAFLTRLQMGGYVVTEDFVYPRDRHGRAYGWGWSLLTTPERLLGRGSCHVDRSPEESYERMRTHLHKILPDVSEKKISQLLG